MLFCCRLTRVVLEKRPLNECSVVVVVELVVIAETEDDLIKRLNMWKHNVENRRMRAKKKPRFAYDKWSTSEANSDGCKMAMCCV